MQTDNALRTYDGNEIYTSEIWEAVDEFTATLPAERKLEEPETFTGLIGYLYDHIFRDTERKHHGCVLDYDDISSFDKVWSVYTQLCGRYRQSPSLFEFSALTGLSPDTLTDWGSGKLRSNDAERVRTIKRWKNQAVAALEKKAVNSNSVGAIFSLKSAHGWRESAPLGIPQSTQELPRDSIEEIAARHAKTEKPELPNLDDFN